MDLCILFLKMNYSLENVGIIVCLLEINLLECQCMIGLQCRCVLPDMLYGILTYFIHMIS